MFDIFCTLWICVMFLLGQCDSGAMHLHTASWGWNSKAYSDVHIRKLECVGYVQKWLCKLTADMKKKLTHNGKLHIGQCHLKGFSGIMQGPSVWLCKDVAKFISHLFTYTIETETSVNHVGTRYILWCRVIVIYCKSTKDYVSFHKT